MPPTKTNNQQKSSNKPPNCEQEKQPAMMEKMALGREGSWRGRMQSGGWIPDKLLFCAIRIHVQKRKTIMRTRCH
jgi:hypothetical protein